MNHNHRFVWAGEVLGPQWMGETRAQRNLPTTLLQDQSYELRHVANIELVEARSFEVSYPRKPLRL